MNTKDVTTLGDSQKLYEKLLNFNLRDSHSPSSKSLVCLCLSMEWQVSTNIMHNKELLINLTDPVDPFFLFTLSLSSEDFLDLKQQQGLLVDFGSFPQSFVTLLEQCLTEEHKVDPKFLLYLNIGKGGMALLDVIETNQFKHLTHLSLKLNAPTDLRMKHYLTSCFKNIKDEKEVLENRAALLEAELKKQGDRISSQNKSHQAQQVQQEAALASLKQQYEDKLKSDKEKAHYTLNLERRKWKEEMAEKEYNHNRAFKNKESVMASLEQTNKELKEQISKLELAQNSSTNSLEKEVGCLRSRLHVYTTKNTELESELKDVHDELEILKKSKAAIEAQIPNREKAICELQEEIDNLTEIKVRLENKIPRMKQEMENKERILTNDIAKANEIIRKLQAEARLFNENMKLKKKTLTNQGIIIQKQEAKIQSLEEALRVSLEQHEDEKLSLLNKVDLLQKQLAETEIRVKHKTTQSTDSLFRSHSQTAAATSTQSEGCEATTNPAPSQQPGGLFPHQSFPSTTDGVNSENNWNFQLDSRYLEKHPKPMMHESNQDVEDSISESDDLENDNYFIASKASARQIHPEKTVKVFHKYKL